MYLTRRSLMAGLSASLALPRMAVSQTAVGPGTLTTVSDGHLVLPRDFILGSLPAEQVDPILEAQGITGDTLEPPCNVTLYQDDSHTVLFDVGSGSEFQPTAGQLVDGLDAAGIAPDEITHVLFTHAHPDHLWGLLDDFGDPMFSEATFMIGQAEWDYWTNPATVDEIGAARQAFAVGAARRLAMITDEVLLIEDGDEVLPGIAARASFGHTPGHMAYRIGSGPDGALIAGDSISNAHVSFAAPAWELGSDQDAGTAAVTRSRLMDELAAEQSLLIGFHLPNGGMGRVAKGETGYRFVGKDQ